jgi:transposase
MSASTSKRYPVELRERAVRMVAEIRSDHESEWAAMTKVAQLLGVGTPETVRKWCRQAEVDAGARPGVTSEDSAELKRLKRENAELKRANAILKAASVFFAAELCATRRQVYREVVRDRLCWAVAAALMKHRGSRSPGTTVIGGKRPREGEPCRYCQTVRARRARSEGAA